MAFLRGGWILGSPWEKGVIEALNAGQSSLACTCSFWVEPEVYGLRSPYAGGHFFFYCEIRKVESMLWCVPPMGGGM